MLIIQEDSPLFRSENMYYKEFRSDYKQIRFYTMLIMKKCPPRVEEKRLLEQQLSEIIKNAVTHGNKNDLSKTVSVWYEFTTDHARVIVQDQGSGFKELEKWNIFNEEREKALSSGSFETMEKYVAWKGEGTNEDDGGNSLFAAVEFWNGGMIYNQKRNKVAVLREFPK